MSVSVNQLLLPTGKISVITTVQDADGNIFEKRDLMDASQKLMHEGSFRKTYSSVKNEPGAVASNTSGKVGSSSRKWDDAKRAELLTKMANDLYQAGSPDAVSNLSAFLENVGGQLSVTRTERAVGFELVKLCSSYQTIESMTNMGVSLEAAQYLLTPGNGITLFGYFVQRLLGEFPTYGK